MPAEADTASPSDNGECWYSYAVLRIVPYVEREEFINAGVILYARTQSYLEVRIDLDESRLLALSPTVDLPQLKEHLTSFEAIAAGDAEAGPIALLSQSERFHWLTAPRSTILQTSPVHVGRSYDPEATLTELMQEMVHLRP